MPSVVAISGSLTHPSRTRNLVNLLGLDIASQSGSDFHLIDIGELIPVLGSITRWDQLPAEIQAAHTLLAQADVIILGSPVYKGSYSGLFKHFMDLIDPRLLAGKIAVLTATGGSDRHALVLEHQLRPLASFFELNTVPFGIFAKDTDFVDYQLRNEQTRNRLLEVVQQTLRLLPSVRKDITSHDKNSVASVA